MDTKSLNVGILAYIGDSVYEVMVRNYLINNNLSKASLLQKQSINYVSANSQAKFLDNLLKRQIFLEEELYTIKRARNYTPNSKPRYTDIVTYKKATALEALFGELYLNKNYDRLELIFKKIVGDEK